MRSRHRSPLTRVKPVNASGRWQSHLRDTRTRAMDMALGKETGNGPGKRAAAGGIPIR